MGKTGLDISRVKLISIAYHLLGSYSEAEDVVQDVMVAWTEKNQQEVASPKAYLERSVVNRSLNRLSSLKQNRIAYKGIWLPEPIPSTSNNPLLEDQKYHVSIGLMIIMEHLKPVERTVFILREVFSWDYESIGVIIEQDPAYCRQILHRAKKKVRAHPPVTYPPKEQLEQLLGVFREASLSGNVGELLNLLKEDVVLLSDGGGKVAAALNPLSGKEVVSKFLLGIQSRFMADVQIEIDSFNETLGLLIRENGEEISSVLLIEFTTDIQIKSLYVVRNPDKLRHLEKKK